MHEVVRLAYRLEDPISDATLVKSSVDFHMKKTQVHPEMLGLENSVLIDVKQRISQGRF